MTAPSTSHKRAWRAALCVLAVLASASCAFSGIDLVKDTRISVTKPDDGDTVQLPLTVTWRAADELPEDRVSYAVFVDKPPIKRGETLKAAVPDSDTNCLRDPSCPDTEYLARNDIYVTQETSAVITRVADSDRPRAPHRVTVIILIDGQRDGEGAFSRTFYVEGDK